MKKIYIILFIWLFFISNVYAATDAEQTCHDKIFIWECSDSVLDGAAVDELDCKLDCDFNTACERDCERSYQSIQKQDDCNMAYDACLTQEDPNNPETSECVWLPYSDESWVSNLEGADKCCEKWSAVILQNSVFVCVLCNSLPEETLDNLISSVKQNCEIDVTTEWKSCTIDKDCGTSWICVDDKENPAKKVCITNTEWDLWINMNADCLVNWQCSYNIYKTLWIRKSDQNPSVWSFVQDIVLAVTMFIGTVIAIVLVVSGILYILSSIKGSTSQAEMAKKGIINSIIWLILVVSSYALVRLVQFLVTAWWG